MRQIWKLKWARLDPGIADPENKVLRMAIRTTIACFLSIFLFQITGQSSLIGWAAFAALAFSQIDTLDTLAKRIPYLILAILLFSLLAFFGISLAAHPIWFLITLPIVIFLCGYAASWGVEYLNVGIWAAFLYVAFGSSIGTHFYALHVCITFLVVGLLCLFISIVVFPELPREKIMKSFCRILNKLETMLEPNNNRDITYYGVESLLASQNRLIELQPSSDPLKAQQQTILLSAHKHLYQLFLMMQNIAYLRPNTITHQTFAESTLANCQTDTARMIQLLATQFKTGQAENFDCSEAIATYRAQIKSIQESELQNKHPDFLALLDYSSYLYHYIKLWELMTKLSDDHVLLQSEIRHDL